MSSGVPCSLDHPRLVMILAYRMDMRWVHYLMCQLILKLGRILFLFHDEYAKHSHLSGGDEYLVRTYKEVERLARRAVQPGTSIGGVDVRV